MHSTYNRDTVGFARCETRGKTFAVQRADSYGSAVAHDMEISGKRRPTCTLGWLLSRAEIKSSPRLWIGFYECISRNGGIANWAPEAVVLLRGKHRASFRQDRSKLSLSSFSSRKSLDRLMQAPAFVTLEGGDRFR